VSTPLVGHTNLEANYVKTPIKPGESKMVEIKVTSLGNLTAFKEVPIEGNANFKVYSEAPVAQTHDNGGQIVSVKTFKVTIVPIRERNVKLDPIRLGYFDPESASYRIITTQGIEFPVQGGDAGSNAAPNPSAQNAGPAIAATPPAPGQSSPAPVEAQPAADDLYVEEGRLQRALSYVSGGTWMLIAIVAGALAIGGAMILRHRRAGQPRRDVLGRIRKSASLQEINRDFRSYLGRQLDTDAAAMRSDELKTRVESRLNRPDQVLAIVCLLDQLDNLLYSGRAPSEGDLQEVRRKTEAVVRAF
jgi:hypothetical protein